MEKYEAKNLIINTFEKPFEKEQFINFILNLLNLKSDEIIHKRPSTGIYTTKVFMDYIKSFYRIAKYEDENGKKIDILIVKLKKETSLERARSMQRNFIAWYLKGSRGGIMKDAALVAFVSPDNDDWRFSFVKIDYIIENGKINEEKSPAKRYSFLVGLNENSHTAKSRFIDFLMDDKKDPNISDIEDAFSVEKVTKEFYRQYRDLFIKLTNSLNKIIENNEKVREEFNKKNIKSVDFTKKLLGQIVFLYFLQKKGWFGVERDANWGTGPKNFLRQIFDKKYSDYKNFFNDILEPLFYNTLSIDRHSNDDYSNKFNCKIPFLNGGLFDPINDYDWLHTDILLPNELFSNTIKTKDDIGTGILDVFDRFNFTVKEDEPLEKEVAVDPEMLGKIFEKLCGVNDKNFNEWVDAIKSKKKSVEKKFNKKYGIYYTPREIVHYMCQESLIQYLLTEMDGKIHKDNIEYFIRQSEELLHYEEIVEKKELDTKTYHHHKILKPIIRNATDIDKKLKKIKVCDPAVGSGAFPVEMISLIAKARNFLSNYISDNNRNIYKFKRESIENSMYGVDIDIGAVEIAKLRFWLSLIVDEEDYKNIRPLPNLSYKIMQGNSLIEEFYGISLELEKRKDEDVLFSKDDKLDFLIQELHKKQNKFFNATQHIEKDIAQKEVEDAIVEVFHYELEKQKKDYFNELNKIEDIAKSLKGELREQYITQEKIELSERFNDFDFEKIESELREMTQGKKKRNFFPWKLYFADVFKNNGGFDVVIANPPYINIYTIPEEQRKLFLAKPRLYRSAVFKFDIYILFIELGLNILNIKGSLCFITSNKWLNQKYGSKIRKILLKETEIKQIIDFKKIKVFDTSTVDTNILIFRNIKSENNSIRVTSFSGEESLDRLSYKNMFNIIDSKDWIELTPLIEFRTDLDSKKLNLLKKIKRDSLLLGEICYINYGARLGGKKYPDKSYFLSKEKKSGFKKFVEGKNLKKWSFYGNLWLDYSMEGMYNPMFKELFESDKICVPNICTELKFAYDSEGLYNNQTIENIVPFYKLKETDYGPLRRFFEKNSKSLELSKNFKIKYLLSLVNSKLINWFFKETMSDQLHCTIDNAKQLPIKKTSKEDQQPFIKIVDKILSLKKAGKDTTDLENQIDIMVYKLYELTYEEVKIVDP